MQKKIVATTLLIAATACSAPTPSGPQLSPSGIGPSKKEVALSPSPRAASFSGMPILGSALVARENGFTDCAPGYRSGLVCDRAGRKEIYGVSPKKTTVTLDVRDNIERDWSKPEESYSLADVEMKDLMYKGIVLTFPAATYRDDCVKAFRKTHPDPSLQEPDECATPGTIANFRYALIQNGWIETHSRRQSTYFYHSDTAAQLTITVPFNGADCQAEILPVSMEQVTQNMDAHRQRLKDQEREVAGARALLEEMKRQ